MEVTPDLATCSACLEELFDPGDRRFRYAFISCTRCGPRFTIMRSAPYERARSSMSSFTLCAQCRREYDDPNGRRYRAEDLACPACGPRLALFNGRGERIAADDMVAHVVGALRSGKICALKGPGGYHLVADAANEHAVHELRRRKRRDGKPFAVMVRDRIAASELASLSAEEMIALCSAARPVVIAHARPFTLLAPSVAPRLAHIGMMLPATPLQHILLHDAGGRPLIVTSGNTSGEPIACDEREALGRLSAIADLFLANDRAITARADESVVAIVHGACVPHRRGRGHAPSELPLPQKLVAPTLAVGARLDASFALGEKRRAILSQPIGDLFSGAALDAHVESIGRYERLFGIAAERIVHDTHPDFLSTHYAQERAREQGLALLAVQHHHAHMAACMAEHGLSGPAIGVCFDGIGYGTDGTLWGGEFLVGDARAARRMAHLWPVALPAAERAIRDIWRIGVGYLLAAGVPLETSVCGGSIGPAELALVERAIERGVQTPLTSSAGRLFDGAAAILGVCTTASYEGQSVRELEALARGEPREGSFPFELIAQPEGIGIDTRPLIRALAREHRAGVAAERIARRFHSTLLDLVLAVVERLRVRTGVTDIVLCGSVFANALLTAELLDALAGAGFTAHQPELVPAQDAAIAYGQLAVAAALDAAS